MSKLQIQKVSNPDDRSLPVFDELDRFVDDIRVRAYELFCNRGRRAGQDLEDWLRAEKEMNWPAAELEEEDDEFELKIALAGFKPEEISVTASPQELIVKASHESSHEEPDDDDESRLQWSEFRSNSIYRRFVLPSSIDVDHVEAEYKRGMLEIEAKKAAKTPRKGKKVKVSAAA